MTEKRQTSQGYIILILQHFATTRRNITNFVMLFQAGVDKRRARTGRGLADADWRTRTGGRGLADADWRTRTGGRGLADADWRTRTARVSTAYINSKRKDIQT